MSSLNCIKSKKNKINKKRDLIDLWTLKNVKKVLLKFCIRVQWQLSQETTLLQLLLSCELLYYLLQQKFHDSCNVTDSYCTKTIHDNAITGHYSERVTVRLIFSQLVSYTVHLNFTNYVPMQHKIECEHSIPLIFDVIYGISYGRATVIHKRTHNFADISYISSLLLLIVWHFICQILCQIVWSEHPLILCGTAIIDLTDFLIIEKLLLLDAIHILRHPYFSAVSRFKTLIGN